MTANPVKSSLYLDEPTLFRLGYIILGAYLVYNAHNNWARGEVYVHHLNLLLVFTEYMLGFTLLVIAAVRYRKLIENGDKWILPLVLYVIIINTVIAMTSFRRFYGTDAIAFSHYAAILLLQGVNPYEVSLAPAIEMFNIPIQYLTPTTWGRWVETLNYPALHFLIFTPFVAVGLPDMRIVVLIFHLATVAILYTASPRIYRPLIFLVFIIFPDLVDFTGAGLTDYLWAFPITLMALYLEKCLRKSAVLYGIACAIKQIPWLLAPFLAIWIWKKHQGSRPEKLRRVITFFGIAAVIFFIPNAYFMVVNFDIWLTRVLTPVSEEVILFGYGMSSETQFGYMPLPPEFFVACVAIIATSLIVVYALLFDKIKDALWVMAPLPMWFSFRFLQNYFVMWIIPFTLIMLKRAEKLIRRTR